MMTGVTRIRMSGLNLQTMMVATRPSEETEETASSVAEGSPAEPSMVMVDEAEVAVIGPTKTIDRVATTIVTIMVKVATSIRMATTRMVKADTEVDGAVWIDPGLTVVAWTEEAHGEVVHEETLADAAVALEEASQGKEYQPVVQGLSSSASEQTRHDRLISQLPQQLG